MRCIASILKAFRTFETLLLTTKCTFKESLLISSQHAFVNHSSYSSLSDLLFGCIFGSYRESSTDLPCTRYQNGCADRNQYLRLIQCHNLHLTRSHPDSHQCASMHLHAYLGNNYRHFGRTWGASNYEHFSSANLVSNNLRDRFWCSYFSETLLPRPRRAQQLAQPQACLIPDPRLLEHHRPALRTRLSLLRARRSRQARLYPQRVC